MLVLKRLSDARSAGDPVLGVIRGAAMNHDGRSSGLTVRLPGERHMTPGTPVTLGFDRARLHLFDRKSGRRLPASEEAGAPA